MSNEETIFESKASIPTALLTDQPHEVITSACYLLIDKSAELNAEDTTIEFDNVTKEGKPIGNWKVTLTRTKEPKDD
jgi:hypothetical protein